MNSVERVHSYSDEGVTPQEAAYEDPPLAVPLSPNWPEHGEVEFRHAVMRYALSVCLH